MVYSLKEKTEESRMTEKAYEYGRRIIEILLAALVLLTAMAGTGRAEI